MSKQKELLKHQKFFIKGMHCPSCEVLIEKELLKIKGVEFADATLAENSVSIYFEDQVNLSKKKINNKLKKLGYKIVEENDFKQEKISFPRVFIISILLIIAFFIFESLGLARYVSVDSGSSQIAFFLLGLVASISSCAALIGGVVLSLSKHWNEQSETTLGKTQPHLLFHSGRLVSFALLGGLLGLIGESVQIQGVGLTAVLVSIVSLIMLVLGLQMLNVPGFKNIRLALPKSLTRNIAEEKKSNNILYPALIGASTFFLPCGFTLIAQGIALTSGSFAVGATIMFGFALGTLPALLFISFTSVGMSKKPHLNNVFNHVVAVLLIFFAIFNMNSQLNVLGLPSLSDLRPNASMFDGSHKFKYEANIEEQVIEIIATEFDYLLQGDAEFEANKPTKLVVYNKDAFGCALYLSVFGLMDDYVILNPGENVIDLGSPPKGSYKITCSMGMVTPVTVNFN